MINQKKIKNKETGIKNPMLKSDLCDFSDAYIVVNRTITVARKIFVTNDFMDPAQNGRAAAATTSNIENDAAFDGKLAFKNNTLFINWIAKIKGILIDNTEDLDDVQQKLQKSDRQFVELLKRLNK